MLKVGAEAPLFTLPDDQGRPVALESFRGQRVVLFFYPKDSTPGCIVEVCDFRNSWQAVQQAGATVLGVSPDGEASHRRFSRRHRLPFPLLADEGHAVASRYGAWGEKSLFGYRYQGILRTTFIIDPAGRISRIFERVRPVGHAGKVLEALHG
ncbi:MAG TPA: thioredoxin-dependent thiol peroxidase [Gemmatimonadales bacterium]|nr:thioredoxin-dependent thiol peroxidase [Gemmatimonadales bacterium]